MSGRPPAGGLPPTAGGRPPTLFTRVPLLMLGFVALFVGAGAGLARLGWTMPATAASAAALHGPLMVCGFFGVVISLERAVAIGRGWAYLGPLLAGLGGAAAVAGQATAAAAFFLAGSGVLLAASIDILRRQRALFTSTMALGAAGWSVGNALWLAGRAPHEVVTWWLAFLILTIAGERLELSRLLPPSPVATRVFAALLVLIVAGLAGDAGFGEGLLPGSAGWGATVYAAGLLALAGWLLKQDIARRTVRGQGLTRFIAVCLLSGYGWLAVGAAVILGAGGLHPGTPAHDAALHAIGLGFVFSMVFGHAPIIFPAVLRVAVPYHPSFYAPLALLHGSLVIRLAGDAAGNFDWVRAGGLLNAVALAAFIVSTVGAVVRGRLAGRQRAG